MDGVPIAGPFVTAVNDAVRRPARTVSVPGTVTHDELEVRLTARDVLATQSSVTLPVAFWSAWT